MILPNIQIKNLKIKAQIVNYLFGIVPKDSKTRSMNKILTNQNKYARIAQRIDNKRIIN